MGMNKEEFIMVDSFNDESNDISSLINKDEVKNNFEEYQFVEYILNDDELKEKFKCVTDRLEYKKNLLKKHFLNDFDFYSCSKSLHKLDHIIIGLPIKIRDNLRKQY